ncbi:unnamed protein product [Ceutorhynchus assimilis]|uniref:SUMO-activating enzyme subunit 1 n=1 Tax=Ceutorhynchus assimilis TaxID=467358 RepID=A0A9N9MDJ0_9CUCU|nr:unnamed protein product [Ceutorhynchus assimilis]
MGIDQQLSAVETELYDRQIRLWGIESQERLRASNVLLIGVRGLGSEIAKNILLSGINSLVILDDGIVSEEEQQKNFFLTQNSIGKMIAEEFIIKAQLLNPLVKLTADTSDPTKKDAKFFEGFTMVVATRIKTDFLMKIDQICRASKIKLLFGDVFGSFGYSISDFQEHEYYVDQIKFSTVKRSLLDIGTRPEKSEKEIVKVKHQLVFPELKEVLIMPNTEQSVDHIKKIRKINPYFYFMLILLEFRNRQGRNPEISYKIKDVQLLKDIKKEVLRDYGADRFESELDDDLFELVFGEVVPVCAIVGGVLAQEVIKGVSKKEVPIYNVFLFDPLTYSGKEQLIKTSKQY